MNPTILLIADCAVQAMSSFSTGIDFSEIKILSLFMTLQASLLKHCLIICQHMHAFLHYLHPMHKSRDLINGFQNLKISIHIW